MKLSEITDRFGERLEERGRALLEPTPGSSRVAGGLPGAGPALLTAALGSRLRQPVVLVAKTPGEAELLRADLETLGVGESTRYLPQRESLPYETTDPHVEISAERAGTLADLLAGAAKIVVTTSRGLVERSPIGGVGERLRLEIATGDLWRRNELVATLQGMGFERSTSVSEIGELAVRGGIVDVFPFGHDEPVRIELWDDSVASLRHFDLLTQRSTACLESVSILPVRLEQLSPATAEDPAAARRRERRSLLDLLPGGSVVLFVGAAGEEEARRRLWNEIVEAGEAAPEEGAALPPEGLVVPPEEAADLLGEKARVIIRKSEPGADASSAARETEGVTDVGLEPHPPIDRHIDRLVATLREAVGRGDDVWILCESEGQLERLEEILEETAGRALSRRVTLVLAGLSGGFRLPGRRPLLVLTDHEIFRRGRRLRRSRRLHGVASLESIASLAPGDYVVHMDHGIGRYAGLERVRVGDETVETLKIEYADGEILRLPHYRLDLLEKWTGVAGEGESTTPPRVHKLGGRQWKKLKARTLESMHTMAAELIELYAHRQVSPGFAFSPATRWQREMESAFLYEDTPDQRAAWEEVRRDMEAPRIMDRLVCGDVGYGKTEVAVRAAFKAVQDGKQVALLAPTTVLVEQHLHTFRERLAGYPVRVEALSRLRPPGEQRRTLKALAAGAVDILIGTHRILSADIRFRDLGLLIVDEEQRFGVRHKERLKELKRSVDVLTLTATPIPRTLQLALGGLRDMSLIETAPRDRMPVITHVLPWSDSVLVDAMRRELERGGQVFFVHDRIETIDAIADRVRRLLPEARLGVAHGRMPERALEQVMARLMHRELDILVSTSIIENGLDVPTANTMIVHRADRFGLAQLYQLRGRVGRSHTRAYCYLLIPSDVTPEALRRLRILEHHTDLGSGYRIALRDLQLRGAGNLLGADQSGFAHAVGFDTYQRMLEGTIRRMRGEKEPERVDAAPQVTVGGEAYLPDEYIGGTDQKMHLYRRISRLTKAAEVDDLEAEIRDRFGPLPAAAERLLASVRLKLLGARLGIEWIRASDRDARLTFRPEANPRLSAIGDAFADRQITVEVRRTQPLSLVLFRGGVEPLLPTLVGVLEVLAAASAGDEREATRGVSIERE